MFKSMLYLFYNIFSSKFYKHLMENFYFIVICCYLLLLKDI